MNSSNQHIFIIINFAWNYFVSYFYFSSWYFVPCIIIFHSPINSLLSQIFKSFDKTGLKYLLKLDFLLQLKSILEYILFFVVMINMRPTSFSSRESTVTKTFSPILYLELLITNGPEVNIYLFLILYYYLSILLIGNASVIPNIIPNLVNFCMIDE